MSVYVLEQFESFCRKMYHRNCEERGEWGDGLLTYEEYTNNNRGFLIHVYKQLEDESFGEALKKGSLKEWMRSL